MLRSGRKRLLRRSIRKRCCRIVTEVLRACKRIRRKERTAWMAAPQRFEEAVPMLLADYCSTERRDTTRLPASDTLFEIPVQVCSDHLRIVSDPIIVETGRCWFAEKKSPAIPALIDLLKMRKFGCTQSAHWGNSNARNSMAILSAFRMHHMKQSTRGRL